MFTFGKRSKKELKGVHPDLNEWVHETLRRSPLDIGVHDGVRTESEQREYVRRGASRSMKSMHLIQKTGYSHAVDILPYINGKLRWDWQPIYTIMEVGREVANDMQLSLRWGGVWDRSFRCLTNDLETEVNLYVKRRKKKFPKRSVFIDGAHIELNRRIYCR